MFRGHFIPMIRGQNQPVLTSTKERKKARDFRGLKEELGPHHSLIDPYLQKRAVYTGSVYIRD